jgi:hypothetical protein
MQNVLESLSNLDFNWLLALSGALLLLLVPTLYFFTARARALQKAGNPPALRPINAFKHLTQAMGRAAESGRPLHVGLGTGGIGDATTAESMAALTLLDQLARKAAAYDAQPLVTTADPVLMIAAGDRVRQWYAQRGFLEGFDAARVRLVAPDRTAYAAGVADLLGNEALSGSVLVGAFGDEYLLMGEIGARQRFSQVAGAADPRVLPFVAATSDHPLLGEEMFAAGAYLGQLPAHVGSLLTQDWMRVFLVLVVLAGVAIKSLA